MKDEKEAGSMMWVAIALIGCCLLLTIILAGGTLAFLGVSLRNNWLIVVSIAVIIFSVIVFLLKRKASK